MPRELGGAGPMAAVEQRQREVPLPAAAPWAAAGGTGGSTTGDGRLPVVGYLPTYRSLDPSALNLDALTHLDIAFANTMDGGGVDFQTDARASIPGLVSAAHAKNVKVLASIAGAAGGSAVSGRITSANVDAYVSALLDMVNRYSLDGIDVDIEGEYVNSDYEPFVLKLDAALPAGKLLTAAVANWNGDDFSSAALAAYDYINVMSYDHCGTWTDPCEHSTYADAQSDMAYWVNDRAVPAQKVILGVPFYGYSWGGPDGNVAITYAEALAAYPAAKTTDWISDGGTKISINSAATIGQKAALAKTYGGIMIWELGQDASGPDSLLQVIHDAQ